MIIKRRRKRKKEKNRTRKIERDRERGRESVCLNLNVQIVHHIILFQHCLSASAIKTKFHSHALRGRDIANSISEILNKVEDLAMKYK